MPNILDAKADAVVGLAIDALEKVSRGERGVARLRAIDTLLRAIVRRAADEAPHCLAVRWSSALRSERALTSLKARLNVSGRWRLALAFVLGSACGVAACWVVRRQ